MTKMVSSVPGLGVANLRNATCLNSRAGAGHASDSDPPQLGPAPRSSMGGQGLHARSARHAVSRLQESSQSGSGASVLPANHGRAGD